MFVDVGNCLKEIGVGCRPLKDPFLANSHKVCKVFERKGIVLEDEEELCHDLVNKFSCGACQMTFQNLYEYDLHYHDYHHFVCAECKKSRPTSRLLEIHVQEAHDSFFNVLKEKQPMYQCFVSECSNKFNNSAERRNHCRDVHQFPKLYRYDIEYTKSVENLENAMETSENAEETKKSTKIHLGKNSKGKTFSTRKNVVVTKVEKDNNSQQELKVSPVTMFIPRQVQQAQKAYAKALTNNQHAGQNTLGVESMMELSASLPNESELENK